MTVVETQECFTYRWMSGILLPNLSKTCFLTVANKTTTQLRFLTRRTQHVLTEFCMPNGVPYAKRSYNEKHRQWKRYKWHIANVSITPVIISALQIEPQWCSNHWSLQFNLQCTDDDNRSYWNVCNMSFVSFSLAVIFILRLFSTSAFRVPNGVGYAKRWHFAREGFAAALVTTTAIHHCHRQVNCFRWCLNITDVCVHLQKPF